MSFRNVFAGRWAAGAVLALTILFVVQVAVVLAAGPETYAMPPLVDQALPTPTPFRFVTPAPIVPSTTSTTTTTAPRAGGFPMELALPVLAGGLAAIGGGSFLLRRKKPV